MGANILVKNWVNGAEADGKAREKNVNQDQSLARKMLKRGIQAHGHGRGNFVFNPIIASNFSQQTNKTNKICLPGKDLIPDLSTCFNLLNC